MPYKHLANKLRYCNDPSSLFALEEDFNAIGLTIQKSHSGKVFICRIEDGQPTCQKLFEDHIPICGISDKIGISKMVARRTGTNFPDTLWVTIQRTQGDTHGGDVYLIAIHAEYTKWCFGGHIDP
jgi:hypothetical protein